MRLSFYGGTKVVTGANYLLESQDLRILVDCGLFQGTRYSERLNYERFAYDPSSINYVFVTHSHMDHVGRLPKLYKEGFRGQVYVSEPTGVIMDVAFPDALEKIVSEAKENGHKPLYEADDISGVMKLVQPMRYGQTVALNDKVAVTLRDAGHILGASIIEVVHQQNGRAVRVVFSGDVGNPPVPLLNPTEYIQNADYLIIESAYGNRIHENKDQCREKLAEVITSTVAKGGVLMIPSFAIERTQELLFIIDELLAAGKVPPIPIFLDSPLAIKITKIYEQFFHYFNPEAIQILESRGGLFKFDWLTLTQTSEESKRINEVPGPKIIIAGSGMSQGGRIIHHEIRYLGDPNSTILFVGYQVAGSLGRQVLDGAKEVSVLGQRVSVRCRVIAIGGFSAHADQEGLLKFVQRANEGDNLKKVFVVQGEDEAASALARKIYEKLAINAVVPAPGAAYKLNEI